MGIPMALQWIDTVASTSKYQAKGLRENTRVMVLVIDAPHEP